MVICWWWWWCLPAVDGDEEVGEWEEPWYRLRRLPEYLEEAEQEQFSTNNSLGLKWKFFKNRRRFCLNWFFQSCQLKQWPGDDLGWVAEEEDEDDGEGDSCQPHLEIWCNFIFFLVVILMIHVVKIKMRSTPPSYGAAPPSCADRHVAPWLSFSSIISILMIFSLL